MKTNRYVTFAALGLALAAAGCTGKNSVQNEEAPASARPASFVKMSDPQVSSQLLSGFYAIESGSWRWTSGKSTILLGVPAGAQQNGGTLTYNFSVPGALIQKSGKVTLTASVNGKTVGSGSYDTAGAGVFTADVPKELLTGDSIKVDFALDKVLPPDPVGDRRELGLIANSIGLTSK